MRLIFIALVGLLIISAAFVGCSTPENTPQTTQTQDSVAAASADSDLVLVTEEDTDIGEMI